jgi:hypothetical protein
MPLYSIVRLAAAAVWLVAAPARPAVAQAQDGAGRTAALAGDPIRFVIAPEAAGDLRRLWASSTAAKQERVACLGGERSDSVTRITRVLLLEPAAADSLGTSAARSIEICGPPRWFGTVHTHIALHDGEHPYPVFSGADRGVMLLWWRRWQVDGTFCILYTANAAHCEIDGITVRQIGGPEGETSY